jgi:outer membrane protein assembly factor BamA
VQRLNKFYTIFTDQSKGFKWAKISMLLLLVVTVAGCNLTKLVPEDQYLLQNNKVRGIKDAASKSEILEQVRHKPNRRIFFVKTHLIVHKIGKAIHLPKPIGEAPIVLDSAKIISSTQSINRYLTKKGYFDNEVTFQVKKSFGARVFGQRKRKVIYRINEGNPYLVDTLKVFCTDSVLNEEMKTAIQKTLIKKGEPVSFDRMSEERSRLNTYFKNIGFYYFNPSMISFVLDTTLGKHRTAVEMYIKNVGDQRVKQTRIANVQVNVSGIELSSDSFVDANRGITFHLNNMRITTDVLANNILFKRDSLYNQRAVQSTFERLVSLELFSNVSIDFVPNHDSTKLSARIDLRPSSKYDFTWQPQVVTTEQRFTQSQSSRNYGIANELSLRNKNVFHNGEIFSLNLRTGLETQFTKDSSSIFSTFIQEVNVELKVPQLLFFHKLTTDYKLNSASTNYSSSFLHETNPYYKRNLFTGTYTYNINRNRLNLYISPLLVSLNQAEYKSLLIDQATKGYLLALERIFTNNLISSNKISGSYSTKGLKPHNYWVVNSNILELAGIFLAPLTNYGETFGVNHSRFLRTDIDFRYHQTVQLENELVYRMFVGIGAPLNNKSVLPYERRFFAGGANYMRGWRIRTVGPGAFSTDDDLQLVRSGELSLVGNLEYRFNILKGYADFDGALFLDAGNVWNIKKDTLFPDGEFNVQTFSNQIAINTGFGMRFDFDFLLLRVDTGIPIWDPNLAEVDRFVIKKAFKDSWLLRRPVWSVAIGYPF